MRLRVIDQGEAPPLASQTVPYGIAAAMAAEAGPVLTVCTPAAAYVSVGLHQDVAAEIDEAYCRSRNLPVLRREVGGGAVLLDPDQLYFHFVVPRRLAPEWTERLFPRFIAPILRTYAEVGIGASHRQPNDIVADGRKLGATAAAEIGTAVVVAGSFLFDFDAGTMARCLAVPDEAFRDTLRQGLDEHLTTMARLLPTPPSRQAIKTAFLRHVADALAVDPLDDVPTPAEAAAIAAARIRHADPAWVRQRGRKLVSAGVKIAGGVHLTAGRWLGSAGPIGVRLLEADGRIREVRLSGALTCLPADGLDRLEDRLRGASLGSETALAGRIASELAACAIDLGGTTAADLARAIVTVRHDG